DPKARSIAKYDLAVLYDPNEKTAPSSPDSIKHFVRIAEKMSVDVEPITKRQLAELAEFDGLFIRETTSIDNHTYRFARRAWQEVKYRPDGSSHEGGFRAFDLGQAPREVIDIAVRAARPIGDGFYGVDLKQTANGIVVMEVNDNPSLEHGIEDSVGKDEIWMRLLRWFIDRFEQ